MTFGEVGTTFESSTSGKRFAEHSVGEFRGVKVLERNRLLSNTTWTTSTVAGANLTNFDVNKTLLGEAQNTDILQQFLFFRADIEVTIRLNSTQFFYGALVATLFPASTGYRFDERMVQSPTVISASSAESVVKTMDYPYPHAWMNYYDTNAGRFPFSLFIDCLAPLTASMPSMASNVPIQVWARYRNVTLAYPTYAQPTATLIPLQISGSSPSEREIEVKKRRRPAPPGPVPDKQKQSAQNNNNINLTVTVPSQSGASSPTKDKNGDEAKKNSLTKVVDAVKSITIGDAAEAVGDAAGSALDYLGKAAFFAVDKPDRTVPPDPVIIDGLIDAFATDIPDSNVVMCLHRSRYLDPKSGRMPQGKDWTMSEYAQIPGVRGLGGTNTPCATFANQGDYETYYLMQDFTTSTGLKIPLDFAKNCATMWRGSIKICLQFFASSFVSARFLVQYLNVNFGGITILPSSSNYDCGLSRIVNVKGDTTDCFTLPWLHFLDWSTSNDPTLTVTCLTELTSPDPAVVPSIYMVLWVAGGPDIQFACPRIPDYTQEWSSSGQAVFDDREKQSLIQSVFKQSFPPIVENCHYDVDNAFCTTEQIGSIADLCKRYSPLTYDSTFTYAYDGGVVQNSVQDANYNKAAATAAYTDYWTFRNTLYGTWRHAFLFRSGGFKFRRLAFDYENWGLQCSGDSAVGPTRVNGMYMAPYDDMIRLTVPYSAKLPYAMLDYYVFGYELVPPSGITYASTNQEFIAARDDIMFGWPILPTGLAYPATTFSESEQEKPKKRSLRKPGPLYLEDP